MLTGLFGLGEDIQFIMMSFVNKEKDRSLKNIPLLGIPASLAFGFVPSCFVRMMSDLSKVWSCVHDLCRRGLCVTIEISHNLIMYNISN